MEVEPVAAGICHKAIRPIIRLTFPRAAPFLHFPGQQFIHFSPLFLAEVRSIDFRVVEHLEDSWPAFNPISTEMHLVNESNLSLVVVGIPRESVKNLAR